MALTAITTNALDIHTLVAAVTADNTGAVVTFVGLVRDHNQGRRVLHLVYEAYEPLAARRSTGFSTKCATSGRR